jgi:hypothetical protein
MDPITFYRLGQIHQQELLEEARRSGDSYILRFLRGVATLWQRFRARQSAPQEAVKQPARRSPYRNLSATSR